MAQKTSTPAGETSAVYLRLNKDLLQRLDTFAASQEVKPARAALIARLISERLDSEATSAAGLPVFHAGDRVAHKEFGNGTVTQDVFVSTSYFVTFDEAGEAPPRIPAKHLKPL